MTKAILDTVPSISLLPSTVSSFIKNTIKALLAKDPNSRPDTQSLLMEVDIKPLIEKIIF